MRSKARYEKGRKRSIFPPYVRYFRRTKVLSNARTDTQKGCTEVAFCDVRYSKGRREATRSTLPPERRSWTQVGPGVSVEPLCRHPIEHLKEDLSVLAIVYSSVLYRKRTETDLWRPVSVPQDEHHPDASPIPEKGRIDHLKQGLILKPRIIGPSVLWAFGTGSSFPVSDL